MADDAARLGAMMRRHLAAAMANAKAAARQGGEEVAGVMRATVGRDEGDLYRSIRVEDATSRKTSRGDVPFVGVVVKAGDETTIVTNASGGRFQNARLQEVGTAKRRANPFFNASYRRVKTRVWSRITRALRKGWLQG